MKLKFQFPKVDRVVLKLAYPLSKQERTLCLLWHCATQRRRAIVPVEMKITRDFRTTLKHVFEERLNRNSSYSLRNFARDLSVAPSTLSQVLKGKRGISAKRAEKIVKTLGFNSLESKRFIDQVLAECSRFSSQKRDAQKRLRLKKEQNNTKDLSIDHYQVIADPIHYVVLAAMGLSSANQIKTSEESIAKKTGLSTLQVRIIFERLQKLDLIAKRKSGYYHRYQSIHSPDGVPSEAIRRSHEKTLNRALTALSTLPIDERDFRSLVFPMSSKDFSNMQSEIKLFLNQLADRYQQVSDKDIVVNLSNQIVPWVRKNPTKEEI